MVARLFGAGLAVLGLTAASASAQCCSAPYASAMPAGYGMPAYAPASSCCGGAVGYGMAGYAAPVSYAPAGMAASSEPVRRGLFGRRSARRSGGGYVTAGDYAMAPEFAP